jgi:SAM-dependent methyltransferase
VAPAALSRLAAVLSGLRRFLSGHRGGRRSDPDAELAWWLEEWDPVIRDGGFHPGDVLEFLPGEEPAETYDGRRWQIARAEVRRVLAEAQIDDLDFFYGETVVDVGPGPLGFPDACPAAVSIGVEPLAESFDRRDLLLRSDAIYLPVRAESLPLLTGSVDVVLARNSLDHVDDPAAVVAEVERVLRPGGTLILGVDLDHPATVTEPHTFDLDGVHQLLTGLEIERERVLQRSHGGEGRSVVVVAEKPK